MCDYKWRFCPLCDERIFKDEAEGDTIKTVSGVLYCIDCANDIEKQLVLRLMDETDCGMLYCKRALQECNWDIVNAKIWLKEMARLRKMTSLITRR